MLDRGLTGHRGGEDVHETVWHKVFKRNFLEESVGQQSQVLRATPGDAVCAALWSETLISTTLEPSHALEITANVLAVAALEVTVRT